MFDAPRLESLRSRRSGHDTMNPTDATLWEIKRDPLLRTTIVALAVLDRPPDAEALRRRVEHAISQVPHLGQRVVEGRLGIGRPRWVAADVDHAFHIRRVSAPAPHDLRSVLDLCGPMASEELDAERPLWELVVVEGLDGERAALVLKVSHALTDGVGGMALLRSLADGAPEAGDEPGHRIPPPRADGPLGRLSAVGRTLTGSAVAAASHPVRRAGDAVRLAASASRLLTPAGAPLSPLMTGRSMGRWAGVTEVPMARLTAAARRAGGTVNDAFVTIALGALADYHRQLGAEAGPLRVTMPVSFRHETDPGGGNQWTPSRFVACVDPDDHPFDALQHLVGTMRRASREPAIGVSQTLAAGIQELPASLTTSFVAALMGGSDAVLTNIPGSSEPISIAGAGVTRLYAFAPTGGAGVNVSLVSHVGTACLGVLADTAAVEHPEALLAALETRCGDFVRRRRGHRQPEPTSTGAEVSAQPGPAAVRAAGARPVERLSALDTSFLRMESSTTPMHMGGLLLLDGVVLLGPDGTLDIEALRRHIGRRLRGAPRLLSRLKEVPLSLGRPVFVPDPGFDITHHVRVVSLPAPGTRAQLYELCEELQMRLLDRARPLFELWFVVGLDPDEFGPDTVALVEKVHHALLDGISGVELLTVLFDPVPGPLQTDPMPGLSAPAGHGPSAADLARQAWTEQLARPAFLGRLIGAVVRAPRRASGQLAAVQGAIGDVAANTLRARPSLNRPVGSRRRLRTVSLPLDRVHSIGSRSGATVNDVVLALVTAGFRALFIERRELMPASLAALVPVSTRRAGLGVETGNRVSALVVDLPVRDPDPVSALASISAQARQRRRQHHAEGLEVLLDAFDQLPPMAVDTASRLVGRQRVANVVVTNLPGPRAVLSLGAAPIREIIPIVPLGGNLTISVAALSYRDQIVLALHADGDTFPDPDLDVVADGIEAALDGLDEASPGPPPSTDRRTSS